MTETTLSRRRFLGASAAAFGAAALPAGALAAAAAQRAVPALPLGDLAAPASPGEDYWWKVRSQFNVVDGMTFMNNGTLGPSPRVVADEEARIYAEIAADPTSANRRDELHERRQTLAAFVGAEPDEVTYTRSTTEGMNIFGRGLDWREGDEVLMCTHEHNGGIEPYIHAQERYGAVIKWVDVPVPPESKDQILSIYENAIGPRTRAIMVSHITYVTGLLMPVKELAELCARRNLLLTVDGAHPLGMIALDMRDLGCHHYAGAGQKWLMAGTGTGLSYIRRDTIGDVWPLIGAGSYRVDGERRFREDSRKYENTGQRHIPSAFALVKSVEFQNVIGQELIESRVRMLSRRLREGLREIPGVKLWTAMGDDLAAGLTLFSVHDIPMANVQQGIMDRERVFIRTMRTGNLNGVRASTHLYNMPHEVDSLLSAVRHIAANPSDYM